MKTIDIITDKWQRTIQNGMNRYNTQNAELRTQNSEIHLLTQNFTIRYNVAFNMINII